MRFYGIYNYSINTELRPAERKLEELFLQNTHRHLEYPHEMESCMDILLQIKKYDALFPDHFHIALEEDSFFQNESDCELYQHLRYLPCIWHSHSFFEIACVMEGCCTNYIAEQELRLEAGDVCIIAPNIRHAISAHSRDCTLINIILRTSTFETAFFETLSENNVLSNFFMRTLYHSNSHPYLLFRTKKDMDTLNYVGYAYDEYLGNRQFKKRMINSVISAFFIMLLRKHSGNLILSKLDDQDNENNLIYILKYIQEHFKTVTLNELASFFNYSERQIQRIIKTSLGMSFSDSILKLKMEYAVRLLSDPAIAVGSIASELGYCDVGSFRHMFKKFYGKSPAEYRKTILPTAENPSYPKA